MERHLYEFDPPWHMSRLAPWIKEPGDFGSLEPLIKESQATWVALWAPKMEMSQKGKTQCQKWDFHGFEPWDLIPRNLDLNSLTIWVFPFFGGPKSSILVGSSTMNHPAIEVSPFLEAPTISATKILLFPEEIHPKPQGHVLIGIREFSPRTLPLLASLRKN